MNSQHQRDIDLGINMKPGTSESLSACMDGELSSGEREALLAEIKVASQLQGEWSLYHCIGDVLRSEELACQRAGFQARFARSLEAEPHVFAPQAAQANAARAVRSRWLRPASLAASVAAVMVVAGVAIRNDVGTQTAGVTASPQTLIEPQPAVAVVPNAYLAAHRQYASGLAMQGMVAHVRTVAHDSDK